MNLSIPCMAIVLLTALVFAQENTTKQVSPSKKTVSPALSAGVVTGRVFTIAKGGDRKPARMAKVYLFFQNGPGVASLSEAARSTPDLFYLQKRLEALQEGNEAATSVSCRKSLVSVDKAILATLAWAKEKRLTELVRFGDADEEGYFTIPKVKPGTYEVVARGQAGNDDACWSQDVDIKTGDKVTVEVSSVEFACSNSD